MRIHTRTLKIIMTEMAVDVWRKQKEKQYITGIMAQP